MTVKKFAISVPEEVMLQVDRAAAARGVTRSRFVATLLRRAARARTDAEVTRQLDRLFADTSVADEQRTTAEAFGAAASTRGTEW
jgi:metal-responsive CopG/Arc/MetJ family transcriptional regulator